MMIEIFDIKPEKTTLSANPVRIIIPTASMDSEIFKTCLKHINQALLPVNSIITAVVSNGPDFCFSKSINAGLSQVSTEDVLLLNDDCFIDPNTISNLVSSLDPNDGILGGVLRYEDGRIQHYGGVIKTDFFSIFLSDLKRKAPFYALRSYLRARKDGIRYIRTYHYTRENEGPLDYVTGALFYIRNDAYKIVGKMDESLVNNWEDVDYSLRVRKAGLKIRVLKNATAIHKEHTSLKHLNDDFFQKLKVFNEKWSVEEIHKILNR